MLQVEHSTILSTFIKLPIVTRIFILSIFEWPFYTGFTVLYVCEQRSLWRGCMQVHVDEGQDKIKVYVPITPSGRMLEERHDAYAISTTSPHELAYCLFFLHHQVLHNFATAKQ